MQRLSTFLKNCSRMNKYNLMNCSDNSHRSDEKSDNESNSRSSYNQLLMLPIISILHQKLESKKYCYFFRSSNQNRNKIENRVSCIEYPANKPIEDRYDCQQIMNSDNEPIGFLVNIFDGHGGWQVAEYCQKHLSIEFQKMMMKSDGNIEDIINQTYDNVENQFLDIARMAYQNGFGSTGKIGACSLSVYIQDDYVYCANSGDSQAILIESDPQTQKYEFIKLNKKLNCNSKKEQSRLKSSFDDHDIVRCKRPNNKSCYVKAVLQPTRAFGDFRLKHQEFNDPLQHGVDKGYRRLKGTFKGPYITHRPEIRKIKLNKNQRFIVMGCDGLWDYLTKQDVTDVVQSCHQKHKSSNQINKIIVEQLFNKCLQKAASNSGMSLNELMSIPQGEKRRRVHDDTTITVIDLNNQTTS